MTKRLLQFLDPKLQVHVVYPDNKAQRRLVVRASEPDRKTEVALWLSEEQIQALLVRIQSPQPSDFNREIIP